MQNEIKIVYRHYVPEALITNFRQSEIEKLLQTKIEIKEVYQTRINNFTHAEMSDIMVYIRQPQTELIAALFTGAIYDALKNLCVQTVVRFIKADR